VLLIAAVFVLGTSAVALSSSHLLVGVASVRAFSVITYPSSLLLPVNTARRRKRRNRSSTSTLLTAGGASTPPSKMLQVMVLKSAPLAPTSESTVNATINEHHRRRLHDSRTNRYWDAYVAAMTDIMGRGRALGFKNKNNNGNIQKKKHVQNREEQEQADDGSSSSSVIDSMKVVQEYLLSPVDDEDGSLPPLPPLPASERTDISTGTTDYRSVLTGQRDRFLNATGFTSDQYEYLSRCLTYLGDFAAKLRSPRPAAVAWRKIRQCGMVPRENCVSTYMYVLSLDDNDNGGGGIPPLLDYCLEAATFRDLLYEPNEKSVTLRIKSLIARGDARGAEDVLSSLPDKVVGDAQEEKERRRQGHAPTSEKSGWKRQRTFQPILAHYCTEGVDDMDSALRLFRQMRTSDGVFLDPDTYALLVASLARNGRFRGLDVPYDEKNDNLNLPGRVISHGPRLFDDIAAAMAEDLLELTEDAATAIAIALCESFASHTGGNISKPFICKDAAGHSCVGRVDIDEETGISPETGTKLRLFSLTETQRKHVHDTLLEMASNQHEEYGERLKEKGKLLDEVRDGEYALQELSKFSRWLQDREGPPFTCFVDGPNVAYYGHGNVHYSQIHLVVRELEAMGEHPLVVMPTKYIGESFWLPSVGKTQVLSERDIAIMDGLLDAGKMYTVPVACLDDYYWMLASVANQTSESFAKPHVIETGNHQGRFPGLRPMLITNDQMRDHRLSLLEPREFRRWISCHIVNYNISGYKQDEWLEDRKITLFPADFFSREIQGNAHPNRNGTVWHFPVTEWPEPARLCAFIDR